jgi:hypothetical protein
MPAPATLHARPSAGGNENATALDEVGTSRAAKSNFEMSWATRDASRGRQETEWPRIARHHHIRIEGKSRKRCGCAAFGVGTDHLCARPVARAQQTSLVTLKRSPGAVIAVLTLVAKSPRAAQCDLQARTEYVITAMLQQGKPAMRNGLDPIACAPVRKCGGRASRPRRENRDDHHGFDQPEAGRTRLARTVFRFPG